MRYDAIVEQLRTWSDEITHVVATVPVISADSATVVRRLITVVQTMRDVADDLELEPDAERKDTRR